MSECKHGLRHGCAYCHASPTPPVGRAPAAPKRRPRGAAMADKMNDRMTALKKRLKDLRGE
ncbi:MAG TPA: hypothetical protein VFL90_07930 [Methylomirabilota bacterium]|nr:hypothetical protein [Methylomirabilota bacterium]